MQRDALNLTSIYTSRHILFKSFYFGGCTLQSHWPSSTRFSPTWILTEEIWTWSNLVALSTTYFVFCCWGHVGMIGCRKVAVNEWNKRVIYSSVYKKNKPLLYILQRLNIYKESDDTDLYQNSLSDFFFLSKAAVGKVTMLLQSGSPSIHFYAGADIWSALITWEVFYMRLSFQAWFVKLVGY